MNKIQRASSYKHTLLLWLLASTLLVIAVGVRKIQPGLHALAEWERVCNIKHNNRHFTYDLYAKKENFPILLKSTYVQINKVRGADEVKCGHTGVFGSGKSIYPSIVFGVTYPDGIKDGFGVDIDIKGDRELGIDSTEKISDDIYLQFEESFVDAYYTWRQRNPDEKSHISTYLYVVKRLKSKRYGDVIAKISTGSTLVIPINKDNFDTYYTCSAQTDFFKNCKKTEALISEENRLRETFKTEYKREYDNLVEFVNALELK